ncbi:uncharacterized protein PFL1_06345 [Pseudozyma flocculosa PF-1]|uniref:Derlin n=2 Tax=Pseudozyma flocculosa TaxID=84751 RepID=A0A5C3F7C6_9BASI|nr:uncharacterized protein PFL1_06345 [Pseudozyma flocculosa PF-1]EPQ26137.1 hypothetical protein PFL1_06345 [Pseudozyma flocculosa PF-1]SPO40384.1 related to DFM1 - ER protein involved in ER-associated protein degradation [Pseudozyma flocculosa]
MDLDSLPPITAIWGGLAVGAALLEYTYTITSFQLFYTPSLVFHKLEVWRLLTTFVYFGNFSIDFLFHLFFFMRYSRMLEEDAAGTRSRGGRATYVYMLLVCATLLVLLSPIVGLPFLGSPLAFVLVYVWSRRNRHVRLGLFGILVITAPYLPWSLAAFGWLINGDIKAVIGDLVGIAVGHFYYFFVDVWPREYKSGGRNHLRTPEILVRLIDGDR